MNARDPLFLGNQYWLMPLARAKSAADHWTGVASFAVQLTRTSTGAAFSTGQLKIKRWPSAATS
jgi:hypothetical protein